MAGGPDVPGVSYSFASRWHCGFGVARGLDHRVSTYEMVWGNRVLTCSGDTGTRVMFSRDGMEFQGVIAFAHDAEVMGDSAAGKNHPSLSPSAPLGRGIGPNGAHGDSEG